MQAFARFSRWIAHPTRRADRAGLILVLLGLCAISGPLSAGVPGLVTDWNAGFVDNAGPNGAVGAFAVWDDGSGEALYAGGRSSSNTRGFRAAGGTSLNFIGRWNGSGWSALGSGLNGPVSAMVAFGDELVVAGSFTQAGGVAVNGIARWNGQRWAGFDSRLSSPGAIVVIQGSLVAAGVLLRPDGGTDFAVVRLNASQWEELGTGFDSVISALVEHNGQLVAAGNFVFIAGQRVNHIARWTGSGWESIGPGVSGHVMKLTVHQGELIAGGPFQLVTGSSSYRVARWNGISWTAVGSTTGLLQSLMSFNGELYAGMGAALGNLARFDGTQWVAAGGGANGSIHVMFPHAGMLFLGGSFSRVGDVAASFAASWDGNVWQSFGAGIDAQAFDMVEHDGGLIAAGRFRNASDGNVDYVARWDGNGWLPLGPGRPGEVNALAVYNSQVIAAGANPGISNHQIAIWDGQSWTPIGDTVDGPVYDLAVHQGLLVAAGNFTQISGVAASKIARWTGSVWEPLGDVPLYDVRVLVDFGPDLVAAGQGLQNGVAVARWNGQDWSLMGSELMGWVATLAVHNGQLYSGGDGSAPSNLAGGVHRWDGRNWVSLNCCAGARVFALTSFGGELIASAAAADGRNPQVIRWNGSGWASFGSEFDFVPIGLYPYGGQLLATGLFSRVGDVVSPYIAAYGPAQSTTTEITQSSPTPSAPGEAVQITVEVHALNAPVVGHVTLTGAPGGSCSDLTLTPLSATTSQAECTMQWNTACPRSVVARYVGGNDGTTVWQPSTSNAFVHRVEGGPECATVPMFADGFEEPL